MSGVLRGDARGFAGSLIVDDAVDPGEVHADDVSLAVEKETAARAAGMVQVMLDDPAVLRRGDLISEGSQPADRAVSERGEGDRNRRPRFLFRKPDRADRLSRAQSLGLVPGQEERQVRQIGVDDQQGRVGRAVRAVVIGMNPEVFQPVRVRTADLRARLDGKGPRFEMIDEPDRAENRPHDVGVCPYGVPEVGGEPRPQHVVPALDPHADRVNRVLEVLLRDHTRPVQRLARFALRSGRSLRTRDTSGPRDARLPRGPGRTPRARRTLAGKKHE